MELTALNSKERKKFYEILNPYFGLGKDFVLEGVLMVNDKNKYFIVDDKYREIAGKVRTKMIGLYIAEINKYGEIRLSIEGSQMIGPKATAHKLKLTPEQARLFMEGEDIDIDEKAQQYFVLYFEDEMTHYIGCGKVKEGKLLNFTPKGRRVH